MAFAMSPPLSHVNKIGTLGNQSILMTVNHLNSPQLPIYPSLCPLATLNSKTPAILPTITPAYFCHFLPPATDKARADCLLGWALAMGQPPPPETCPWEAVCQNGLCKKILEQSSSSSPSSPLFYHSPSSSIILFLFLIPSFFHELNMTLHFYSWNSYPVLRVWAKVTYSWGGLESNPFVLDRHFLPRVIQYSYLIKRIVRGMTGIDPDDVCLIEKQPTKWKRFV